MVTNDVRPMLIALVDSNDHLESRCIVHEIDDLLCLRHHSIIGRDDEDDDICYLGSSSSHACEGSVSWSVDERDGSRDR